MKDGTAAITDLQAKLLLAAAEDDPAQISGNEFRNLDKSTNQLSAINIASGLPYTVPPLVTPGRSLCLTGSDGTTGPTMRMDPTVPAGVPTGAPGDKLGRVQADLVHIRRGQGALVAAAAVPGLGTDVGTVSIVTDTGVPYPVASRELLPKLGYTTGDVRAVPAELISLLPPGPALDPVKARQFNQPGADQAGP